ncbi:MAG: PAS domain-containing protein [Pseudomonadota bacterium]
MATISKTLARFVRESPIALTLASPGFDDCPLVLVNDAFSRLTGYPADYALGRNCRFLQGSQTEPEARDKLRVAIENQTEAIVPITNYRRDGSKFRNLVFVFPVFGPGGKMLYMMGSQYDVTAPSRTISPREYGQILDETISISNPLLATEEDLHIDFGNFDPERIADLVKD